MWHNQKMKVAVVEQTLSSSVAAGVMYLHSLNLKQFENCEQTAEFIQNINDIFDILNTKSKHGKKFKSPLKLDNYPELHAHLNDITSYLHGTKLVHGLQKTFILCFSLSAKSTLAIVKKLLTREQIKFNYLLTHCFSKSK